MSAVGKAVDAKRAKERHAIGQETQAIHTMVDHLLVLTEEQRSRVLAYVIDLFGFTSHDHDL